MVTVALVSHAYLENGDTSACCHGKELPRYRGATLKTWSQPRCEIGGECTHGSISSYELPLTLSFHVFEATMPSTCVGWVHCSSFGRQEEWQESHRHPR